MSLEYKDLREEVNMNSKTTAIILGIFVAGLGMMGLLGGEGRMGDSMNINLMLDVVRIVLGSALIISGFGTRDSARTALMFFGIAYLGMFVAGLASPQLFGMTPDGLGWIDQTLHLVGGVLALAVSLVAAPDRRQRLAI